MTTAPRTTPDTDNPSSDPHGLADAGEPLADEAELGARFGATGTWLRRLRRQRRVRYIDLTPTAPPGRDAGPRYLYAVEDIRCERARVEAAQVPAPTPPTPPTLPTQMVATLRGAVPEVVIVRRRAGGSRP